MRKITLAEMTVDQPVDRFAEIGAAQDLALLGGTTGEFKRLYKQMDAVDGELRARGQQARLALVRLYVHPNIQVRLQAATWTLGIAPVAARKVIEEVSESLVSASRRCWHDAIEHRRRHFQTGLMLVALT